MLSLEKIEKLKELEQKLKDLGVVDVKSAIEREAYKNDINILADDAIRFLEAILNSEYTKRQDFYKLRDRNTVFVDGFEDRYDVAREFAVPVEEFDEYELLIAIYDLSEAYSGDAYVLMYKKDAGLYEAHGSHCSCMGLEGQFEPESVPVEALKKRIVDNNYCYGAEAIARPYIKEILDLIS